MGELSSLGNRTFARVREIRSRRGFQQLGEGAGLGVAPELSDKVGPLEVGLHEDVEQLGAGSGPEGVKAFPESAL
jgi:hypothetical protein